MKEGVHPKYFTTTAHCACGATYEVGSTQENIRVDICSKCHPLFTGTVKLIDTEGRVEKFKKKFEKAAEKEKMRKETAERAKKEIEARAKKEREEKEKSVMEKIQAMRKPKTKPAPGKVEEAKPEPQPKPEPKVEIKAKVKAEKKPKAKKAAKPKAAKKPAKKASKKKPAKKKSK